jgi:hypothetical protein
MRNQIINVSQCKVCNSHFRNIIEKLHLNGLSPEKIYEYLQNLSDEKEKEIVAKEDIKPSSIRRHLSRHFKDDEIIKVKTAETKARVEQSRSLLQQGISITIDKVNHLSHLIDVAMIKLEEVDLNVSSETKRHQLTMQYMNTIKNLIESLGKLTGELRQEGTVDIHYFDSEITHFADIVLQTIRIVDNQLGLQGQLEVAFATEFANQWKNYKERQELALAGKPQPNVVNTFNEIT